MKEEEEEQLDIVEELPEDAVTEISFKTTSS